MADVSADAGALYAEFNAQSLMGGRRVTVIKDATNLLTKPLKELLASSSSDTLLVIMSNSLKSKDSLAVFAKDEDTFYHISCYDDRDEDISAFASDFIRKNGLRIDNTSFQLLCSRLSNDRKISANELEKLITYMGDKKDIETFVENAKRLNKAVTLAGINKMGCNFDDEILEEYFMIANQHVHVLDEFNEFM